MWRWQAGTSDKTSDFSLPPSWTLTHSDSPLRPDLVRLTSVRAAGAARTPLLLLSLVLEDLQSPPTVLGQQSSVIIHLPTIDLQA